MELKLHPELALAALRLGKDRELRVWVLARGLDVRGHGQVRVRDLVVLIERELMRGLSPGSLRRLLSQGDGIFWTRYTDLTDPERTRWIRLRGLRAVCEVLNVEKLRRSPVLVPLRWARGLRAFRSACFAALFAGEKWSGPISRRVLSELSGASARTQRNWSRALGDVMEVRSNAALADGENAPEGDGRYYVDLLDGAPVTMRRLPNSYRCDLTVGARGMTRSVNKELRAGDPPRSVGGGKREHEKKLFVQNPKAVSRRLQECAEGDQFYALHATGRSEARHARSGAVVWTCHQIADRRVF